VTLGPRFSDLRYTYWVQTLTTHEHWVFATLSRHNDEGESDDEGVARQGSGERAQAPGTPGRSGGVSLGNGKDAALGNGKDAASDGE